MTIMFIFIGVAIVLFALSFCPKETRKFFRGFVITIIAIILAATIASCVGCYWLVDLAVKLTTSCVGL